MTQACHPRMERRVPRDNGESRTLLPIPGTPNPARRKFLIFSILQSKKYLTKYNRVVGRDVLGRDFLAAVVRFSKPLDRMC